MFQIKRLSKDILNTILRFPLPILAGVLAFVFIVLEMHVEDIDSIERKNYIYIKLFLECFSAISYFTAVDIFSESKKVEWSKRIGLYILGFCILGLHYYSITPGMFDSESVFISRYLIFITCFHLLVSFLAFYHHDEIQSFWQFNYFLFVKFIVSISYSLTLFIGLSSALLAIDKLFKVDLDYNYYVDLLLFIFLIVNTIIFLYSIPKSYEVFGNKHPFKKSIRIFVQYILMPIVLVYIVILYLYLFRIVMYNTIPSGWVCIPILIFAIAGILTYLLIYPIRLDSSYKTIYLFSKYFFYILLPLLSLYFIAIIKRIMPYGITEDRYLVFMLGVWLLIISVYIIISKKDNIIIIPVSLFFVLFISAIGPWGMFQLSVQNQVRRLEFLLNKNHLLVNHKLVSPSSDFKIPENNANSIRSILNYLNKRGEINKIHTWLDEKEQKVLSDAIKNNQLNAVNAIFTNIHIEQEPQYTYLTYYPISRFLHEIPINLTNFKNMVSFVKYADENSKDLYMAEIIDTNLYIFKQQDTLVKQSVVNLLASLKQWESKQDSIDDAKIPFSTKLKIMSNERFKNYAIVNDSLILMNEKYKIYLNNIELYKQDSVITLKNINGILLY
ncbi:MAG TPA: DUF4153 domain-containing protein [Chitinophagaceae bacterium]|jgi:hypothetical protein|nr:DUF4153 domain-containing protein [Chitinophagaceae bacterium]